MLYTAHLSVAKKLQGRMKCYYVKRGYGNDEIAPDKADVDLYESEEVTWQGFILNYQLRLRKPEAEEWMTRASAEAVDKDVVLVDSEQDAKRSIRVILAEMMASMFGGRMNFRYKGELKQPA